MTVADFLLTEGCLRRNSWLYGCDGRIRQKVLESGVAAALYLVGTVPALTSGAQMVVPPCKTTNLPFLMPIS